MDVLNCCWVGYSGSGEFEYGGMGNKSNGQRLGELCSVPRGGALQTPFSQKEDSSPTMGDLHGKFYECYHKPLERTR